MSVISRDSYDSDLTDAELQKIQEQVDVEISTHGLPKDEDLHREVESLNDQQFDGLDCQP